MSETQEALYHLYRHPEKGVIVVAAQWFDRWGYDEDRWVGGWDRAFDTQEEAEAALLAETPAGPGPDGVCWEHQAGELPIRLSFSIKVF